MAARREQQCRAPVGIADQYKPLLPAAQAPGAVGASVQAVLWGRQSHAQPAHEEGHARRLAAPDVGAESLERFPLPDDPE